MATSFVFGGFSRNHEPAPVNQLPEIFEAVILFLSILILLLLVAVFLFVFHPMRLGPEPQKVLPDDFFTNPHRDLNGLELLIDGEEAFHRIVQAIRSAESSVFVQTYIWKNDHIGRGIVAELKKAAERGVQVTVRKDLLGTFFELMDMLKGRASPVFTKSGLRGIRNVSVDLGVLADRDHSKYFMVDERVVIFGGMNIADEYHKDWHDYMAMIGSPRFAAAFKNTVLKGSPWPNSSPFFIAVNDGGRTEIRTALLEVIGFAKKRIVLEHAYFSDSKILEALIRAGERGVQVDVLLPVRPGTHLYANRVTMNRLLKSAAAKGSRMFLYPRMSHAKVMLADGVIAAIGSANLTPRSMRRSREVTLFVHAKRDHPFIRRLRNRLSLDTAQSELVLNPFDLSLMDRLKALAGKYVW